MMAEESAEPEAKVQIRLASNYDFKCLYQMLVLQCRAPIRLVDPTVYILPRESPEQRRWLARAPAIQ